MATPKTISKSIKRKGKKQYTLVTFSFSDEFDEVTLPSLKQFPPAVLQSMADGTDEMQAFLNNLNPGLGDIFSTDPELALDADETEALLTAWSDASGVDQGKSEA
ncbi:MAG: hypothetical protein ACTH9H_11865 [Galactobacter sp.]